MTNYDKTQLLLLIRCFALGEIIGVDYDDWRHCFPELQIEAHNGENTDKQSIVARLVGLCVFMFCKLVCVVCGYVWFLYMNF